MRAIGLFCSVALSLGILLPTPAYADDGFAAVELEVEKQLEGDAPSVPEEYSFALEGEDGAPLPSASTAKIVGEGMACFPEIVYTEPGTYRYTVREIAGDSEDCSYDPSVYDVAIQVTTDEGGRLSAAVWATKRGDACKSDGILFVNRYETPLDDGGEEEKKLFGLLPVTGDSACVAFGALAIIVLSACAVIVIARRGSDRQSTPQNR